MSPIPSSDPSDALRVGMRSIHDPLQCLDALATVRSFRARQGICWQGQPANTWYRVMTGAASSSIHNSAGRRQIVDLLFPGDFFGMTNCAEYDCTVAAVASGTAVASYPRKSAEALVDSSPSLTREIREVVFDARLRLQGQLLIVARITVQQKVGSFLLAMAERLACARGDSFALPVSRYDIADYLAVSTLR